mmetsp:Transcript_20242/g.44202  ORF Transcript_20242/g.44202 Transcript_20242/m.44202 type:complete len:217 (+) Transcript_20242:630-1280(+)
MSGNVALRSRVALPLFPFLKPKRLHHWRLWLKTVTSVRKFDGFVEITFLNSSGDTIPVSELMDKLAKVVQPSSSLLSPQPDAQLLGPPVLCLEEAALISGVMRFRSAAAPPFIFSPLDRCSSIVLATLRMSATTTGCFAGSATSSYWAEQHAPMVFEAATGCCGRVGEKKMTHSATAKSNQKGKRKVESYKKCNNFPRKLGEVRARQQMVQLKSDC